MILRPPRRAALALVAALALLQAGCHDARRDNPLDPELTPPVEPQATPVDSAGAVVLAWQPYAGTAGFAEYRVLRNQVNSTLVDTLARLTDPATTSFTDTTLVPDTRYEYRVAVVNTSGFESASPAQPVSGFGVDAVALVEVDNEARDGALVLRWRAYRGADFAAYRVRRTALESARMDTLALVADSQDTVYTDTTAFAGTDYLYAVDTEAAGRVLASNAVGRRLTLPPVELSPVEASSRAATATLQWSAYAGPRFRAYRVLRSAPGLVAAAIATFDDPATTTFADTALLADTQYTYRVVVDTDRGERVDSQERSASLHPLVGTWPLDAPPGAYVRLYAEADGRIAALVSQENRVRALIYDREGRLLEEQALLSHDINTAFAAPVNVRIHPQSVATVVTPAGRRLLSLVLGDAGDVVGVLAYDAAGQPVMGTDRPLFRDELGALGDVEHTTVGVIALDGGSRSSTQVRYDNLAVSTGPDALYGQDFSAGRPADLSISEPFAFRPFGASLEVEFVDGAVSFRYQNVTGGQPFSGVPGTARSLASKRDPSWQGFRLLADLSFRDQGVAGIRIGTSEAYSTLNLILDTFDQSARLRWIFVPPQGSGLDYRTEVWEEPFPVIPRLTYRLGLGLLDGAMTATVSSSVLWSDERDPASRLGCMALLDGTVALTTGTTGYSIAEDGRGVRAASSFPSPVSELRVWHVDGRPWMGACLRQENTVAFARTSVDLTTGQANFPTSFRRTLGAGAGQAPGEFLVPLSFDAGPDGRLFVLDAGNSRIQAFDPEGGYITHWGRLGSGPGQFDFSDARGPEPFAGSVAVDDEGYIYVADAVNARIQRFAP